MFKLPQNYNQCKMLTTFSAFEYQKSRISIKSSPFRTLQRPKTSQGIYSTIQNKKNALSILENKQQPQRRLVPRSTLKKKRNIYKNTLSQYKFIEQILISPSNKKIKYNANKSNVQQMQSNIMKINFLIQPCKVKVMPVSIKNQVRKMPYFQQKQKYTLSQRPSSGVKKHFPNFGRKTANVFKCLEGNKKQQILQPWDIEEYNYESIKLSKNYV